jgi:hypothetical protein
MAKRQMPSGPLQSFCLGENTRHRSVKCFLPSRSWLRLFRMVGVILETVASNVLSTISKTLTEALTAQAMRPFCKAAAIGRSAPESARAHSILLSVAVVRGWSRLLVSADRTSSGPHRPSPTGTAGDRPAERLGEPHRYPVVEPFGRSGRDADRCRVHRHGRGADPREEDRPG